MTDKFFSQKKIAQIFGVNVSKTDLFMAEEQGRIAPCHIVRQGRVNQRGWHLADLPKIGEIFGSLSAPSQATVISVFTTKGGVLKTTLSLNVARMAALHNIKTLVLGCLLYTSPSPRDV